MPPSGSTPDQDPTERLAPGAPGRTAPSDRGGPAPDDHESATFLDPAAWDSTPAPTSPTPAPPAPAPELRRFGPGVPPQAAAVWRGEAPAGDPVPPARRRRAFGWLVWAAVLLVLLAVLLTRCRADPPLGLTGVSVTAAPAAGPTCGGTAVLTATVTTNGNPGTIHYRWLRSDGTSSGELVQPVQSGERRVDLVLRWTFDGPGTLRATATVEILTPQQLSGSATFDYACTG
ncbi:hypothetical protein ACFV0O_27010 [Kitasatospora sp. NPDC059577]|uniref:hypothetical protein n=1 Tax=Kitasatospora sp. NPDC059577 TaxID=3346873 RepID=UPI00368C3E4F